MEKMRGQNVSRIWQYDFLKSYACFLVVWGHAIVNLTSSDCIDNPLYRFIYSFHMSLFMMISGFFSSSVLKNNVSSFLKKKIMQLLYPCITWGGILFFIINGYRFLYNDTSEFTIPQLLTDFYWYSDFWFLKSCFLCFCLFYFGAKLFKSIWLWGFVTLLLSQFLFIFQVSFMYPAFFIGILLKKYDSVMPALIKYRWLVWSLFGLFSLFLTKDVWISCHGISLDISDHMLKSLLVIFVLRLFRMIIGILGALSFIILFRNITKSLDSYRVIKSFCSYGRYTLEIYVIHSVLFVYVASRFITLDDLSYFTYNFVVTPMISFIVIYLCNCIVHLLQKKEFLYYLFFGRRT